MRINLLYFARLREVFGIATESLEIAESSRVADLLEVLRHRGDVWAMELAPGRAFRVAVGQEMVDAAMPLVDNAEVAIFPPVTGG